MMLYHELGEPYALEVAEGLMNSAYDRWLDDDFGGGLKYDSRKMKSLYQVGVLNCSLLVFEATGDTSLRDRMMGCYEWIESHLLRPDGLYWCEYGEDGPWVKERPEDIFEGGSVTFLGGNMGMAVLHARLYRLTGEAKYLERALRTADAIAAKQVKDGIYLNDRDAWSNGTFAGMWAEEVLSLPGISPEHRQLLFRTADSIFEKARTPDGYYSGCWGGPLEGPASVWARRGFLPQQSMTSANTTNLLMAAALAEKAMSR
jgi:predicted alpha-1,6-mannanase (GH76 family)